MEKYRWLKKKKPKRYNFYRAPEYRDNAEMFYNGEAFHVMIEVNEDGKTKTEPNADWEFIGQGLASDVSICTRIE